jgi:hypothetical protein
LWISRRTLFAVFILFGAAFASSSAPDNLQRFLQLFDKIAYCVAEQIAHDGAPDLGKRRQRAPEEKFFSAVWSRFCAIPGRADFTEPVDSLQAMALSYRLHHCAMVYQPLPGGRWFGSTPWQRTAGVFIEVGAREAKTRQVRFQNVWQESVSDTVAEKSLSRLENANLPFTIGRREKRQDGFNWLEAALITTATGVVVYLFYSLRSR